MIYIGAVPEVNGPVECSVELTRKAVYRWTKFKRDGKHIYVKCVLVKSIGGKLQVVRESNFTEPVVSKIGFCRLLAVYLYGIIIRNDIHFFLLLMKNAAIIITLGKAIF